MTIPVPVNAHLCRRPHPAGLGGLVALIEGVETALPLAEVRVRTKIVGDCARTVVEQVFDNPHDQPLEATHIFPLPEDGAVVAMTIRAGDMEVHGICKEKEQAERDFAQARQQGHRAALLTQQRDDIHTLAVTRIPPGEQIRVELEVVERLKKVDGTYRWRFPTVIAPRYLVGTPVSHEGKGVLPATDRVPDADRLQPPLRLQGGTTLDLEVHVQGPVRNLSSAQHAVSLSLEDGVRVAPTAATLDRDFVLAFSTAAADQVVSRAWTDGSYTLLTVEPPAESLPATLPRDAIFVVDISGSMGGVKMTAAKRALQAAVRGLGDGDRFRIIAFDNRVEPMSPDLLPFNADTLQRADAFIESLVARGGTEMLPAIQEALSGHRPANRSRSVLFVTDGQAHNEAELTAAIANRRQGARFFTFGIDTAVNSALLERLARVGGGTCELATPSDDIEEALANLEARFGSPVLDSVEVEGMSTARLTKHAVFTGRPATLLLEGTAETLTVKATGPQGEVRLPVTPQRTGFSLGALWARERVTALQDRLLLKPFEEEALRPEILRIALAFGIVSRFTAFVAVDKGRIVDGVLKDQVQPAEAPAQWGMLGGGGGAPVPSSAPPHRGGRGAPAPAKMKARRRARRTEPTPVAYGAAPEGGNKGALDLLRDMVGGLTGARQAKEEARSVLSNAPSRDDKPGAPPMPPMEIASGDALDWEDAEEEADDGFAAFTEAPEPAPAPPPSTAFLSAPKPQPERMAEKEKQDRASANPASELARTQDADGSFGGSVARTVAALLTLLLLGHTRRTGSRRRTVAKAAAWLAGQSDPLATLALTALAEAERGSTPSPTDDWRALVSAGREGQALEQAMR